MLKSISNNFKVNPSLALVQNYKCKINKRTQQIILFWEVVWGKMLRRHFSGRNNFLLNIKIYQNECYRVCS